LRDVEGTVWYVPNGEIKRVGNKSQQWSRALLDIAVASDTDVDRATQVIRRVAEDLWRADQWKDLILAEPEVWGVEEIQTDRVVIRLVVKTKPLEQWRVARELRARIKHAFDEAGVEMPYTTQKITYQASGDPPAPIAGAGSGEPQQ
jgi:small conductance mechanosensitive channel